ncbi:MAG: uncharacterized protein QOG62_933 [Thermoleophilaceae bacterium]|jgi:uncharacterized membrane protein YfcA|nr:uncharacterized protein [Thermoleophilaceae bacterium]
MDPVLLAVPFGLLIGLVVGTVGGGGAILALPVLVYLLGQGVGPASTSSLIVVTVAASFGASLLARDRHVCWRIAATFVVPAAVGAFGGALASATVSARVLVLAFVPVMVLAAAATWTRATEEGPADEPDGCPEPDLFHTLGAGLAVGFLTGFFGVGGGFLIVPVLTTALAVPMRRAIATSLVIIATTGLFALLSHLGTGAQLNIPVTLALSGATAVGALIGAGTGRRLPAGLLARAFALVVVVVAGFLLVDVLALGGPPVGS